MMSCRQCKYFECVDCDTDPWKCGDPVSWCNPDTGEEVCRYWHGAVQRETVENRLPVARTFPILISKDPMLISKEATTLKHINERVIMQEQMDRMVDSLHQSSSEDVAAEILAESSAQQNRKNVTKTIRQVYKEETGKDAEIESLEKEVKRLKTEIAAIENRLRVVDYTAPQFLKDLRKTAR